MPPTSCAAPASRRNPPRPADTMQSVPNARPKRKPAHQKLECLGITIDEKGVTWGCNHCNWKGGGSYEPCPARQEEWRRLSPFVAQYIYRQADGAPYLKVCRTAEKQFPQFHWDGSGWKKGKPNGPKIPYRLPELLAASVGTTIYFCEGEKDADAFMHWAFWAPPAARARPTDGGRSWRRGSRTGTSSCCRTTTLRDASLLGRWQSPFSASLRV